MINRLKILEKILIILFGFLILLTLYFAIERKGIIYFILLLMTILIGIIFIILRIFMIRYHSIHNLNSSYVSAA